MSVELKSYNPSDVTSSKEKLGGEVYANPDAVGEENLAYSESDVDSVQIKSPNGVKVSIPSNGTEDHEIDEWQPHEDAEWENPNCCQRGIGSVQAGLASFYTDNKVIIWRCIYVFLLLCYMAYFIAAMIISFGDEGSIRLLVITCFAAFCTIYYVIKLLFGRAIWKACLKPIYLFFSVRWHIFQWFVYLLFLITLILVLVFLVVLEQPRNLISLVGIVVYLFLCYIFSHNPARVQWRPVIWGLFLQFVFALLILKTDWGYAAFQWLGDRVTEFLNHSDAGAKFIFGEAYLNHFFAFKVLPVVVFFSTIISVLYYLEWMQVIIEKVAWVMQVTMGTTAAESLNAAGNIFIGQSEAPLMIRPLIQDMTNSELHAVMTGGYATIAGSVLAAYILFGVPANHLLSASVMSAPAALAISKLFYPETKKSRTTVKDVKVMQKSNERNIIQAASSGASQSIKLVANIAANLIAFLSILEFVNKTLTWIGHRVGLVKPDLPELTFELICSYLFYPLAFVMGTDASDCRKMAELIGTKTFLNEFVAYDVLGKLIANKKAFNNYTEFYNVTEFNQDAHIIRQFDSITLVNENRTLVGGFMSDRSDVIATYALCGFANLGSIGIMLGALGVMAPHRKSDLAKLVLRAMIAGNIACFMTACIAGLLTTDV